MVRDGNEPRTPPHDPDAEAGTLGSMLLSPDAAEKVRSMLTADAFYSLNNQTVFEAICAVADAGAHPDIVVVRDWMVRERDADAQEATRLILMLAESVPTSDNAEHYATIVRDKARLREIAGLAGLVDAAYEADADPVALTAKIAAHLGESALPSSEASPHAAESVEAADVMLKDIAAGKHTVLPTGLAPLDKIIKGFNAGTLNFLCARPGIGKTALVCNIIAHIAVELQEPVLFFSAEMPRRLIGTNIMRILGGVDWYEVPREGRYAEQWASLSKTIAMSPLWIDDSPNIEIERLYAKAKDHWRRHNTQLIVIDYLQILRAKFRAEKQNQVLEYVVEELKRLSRECDTRVLCLSQVTRSKEEKHEPTPKGTGAIEETAYVLIQMQRGKGFTWENEEPNITERRLVVAKNKEGPVGHCIVRFNKPLLRFEDPSETAQDECPF